MSLHNLPLEDNGVERVLQNISPDFKEEEVIHNLKHFLPAQAPLKDFVHHNTLHAFQGSKFYEALNKASTIFGYKTLLSLREYRSLYEQKKISHPILERVIRKHADEEHAEYWLRKMLYSSYPDTRSPRVGKLRASWKKHYALDIDSKVHPKLFRIVCSYLDQGIAMWNFPVTHRGFLSSIKELELHSLSSFFRTKEAKNLLLQGPNDLQSLLRKLVGDEKFFEQYLFDQQFAHPGWSGMVSAIEDHPETLVDHKKISLQEFIRFELLLELDTLLHYSKDDCKPLGEIVSSSDFESLFAPVTKQESFKILTMWQDAFEWTFYDQVLAGIQLSKKETQTFSRKSFQAMFCIDDRECSLRRYLESLDPSCETFGTPGFFGVEFFFKPMNAKSYTKLCPTPVTPKHLIKEEGGKSKTKKDLHFHKKSHSLFRGWLITNTLGFWSAIKLFFNIFRPTLSAASATSFQHMDKDAHLTIQTKHPDQTENGLQVGFTVEEMAIRVENLLRSIGLIKDFAEIVYVVGHGSSTVNNPHYAAYDCGACSGRPGSVNARVFSHMANHPEVRGILKQKDIDIPDATIFVGGLHDTTRDEIVFYDEAALGLKQKQHEFNRHTFEEALSLNAKERSRRFELINSKEPPEVVHENIKRRSVSLFEPRPELNHATNALCIIGRRELSRNIFLDRRSFLNSYDYSIDPNGGYLFSILQAATNVCGGVNLEYYFSRVDNTLLGAGTKLPHNVMGLFGVANGFDGDLRPGLPSQMIEVHDSIRLLMIIEHFPETVLQVIKRHQETYEWFQNEWINLAVIDPRTSEPFLFSEERFSCYEPLKKKLPTVTSISSLAELTIDNLPVYLINE